MRKRALFLLITLAMIISQAAHGQSGSASVGLTIGAFDSDRDGIPDSEDEDDDNDGIEDADDSLTGNSNSVQSSTATVNVSVNGTANLTRGFSQALDVLIKDVNVTLVNFSFSFSEKTLNLANVTMERTTVDNKGSVLVRGITLTAGNTKTMYVDNANTSIDRLCIKDAQIDLISEISSDCSGANETAITCPGSSGSYTCSKVDDNTRFKITGLSHTGIIQQAAASAEDLGSPGGGDSTGGGGGGGGGGGTAQTKSDFDIDKDTIKIVLRQGETKEEKFSIKNTGDTTLDITTYLDALKGLIVSPSSEDTKSTLNPGEEQTINMVFGAGEDLQPDIYTGYIRVKSGSKEKTVNTIVEVDSAKPLFDVDVEVLPEYKSIFPGEDIFIEVSLFNVRGFGRVDVVLEYSIKDFEGNVAAKEEETVAVETEAKFVREMLAPSSLGPGTYVASVKVTFENSIGIGSDVFEVKAKTIRLYPIAIKDLTTQLLIGILAVVAISIFLAYRFMPRGKPAPKTKEEEAKMIKEEGKLQKLEKELEAMEKAFKSGLISEESYLNSKERIGKEIDKLRKHGM
ncbi:hypothetical protein HYU09_02470 [Candidatus Woesearchaeota archaeon]|nr:hypothetical protein [Candidatus Woesearchaeota archaeon]